jgi:hypothetical protein
MPRPTRATAKQTRQHDDPPTTELFMYRVITTTKCVKHNADETQPCFSHWPLIDDQGKPMIWGICNHRAIKAGYDAPISETSTVLRQFVRSKGASENN